LLLLFPVFNHTTTIALTNQCITIPTQRHRFFIYNPNFEFKPLPSQSVGRWDIDYTTTIFQAMPFLILILATWSLLKSLKLKDKSEIVKSDKNSDIVASKIE
jgi:hypothetical protein